MTFSILSRLKIFEGEQIRFQHDSMSNNCVMQASIFLPGVEEGEGSLPPVLYWLSGLTCTDENFVMKSGMQRYAAKHKIAIVSPDTSPRGKQVPDDEEGAWDFGLGAGFYLSATLPPWSGHYQMYHYVTEELPAVIATNFAIDCHRQSISGHSMGGHGALTIALKNPEAYQSVSAFAPICSPMNCFWGEKAFSRYLGQDRQQWQDYDSCYLIRRSKLDKRFELLIDQGLADNFIDSQLKPSLLEKACQEVNYPLNLRFHEGYDHSYFFIATFIGEHIDFHARYLKMD